VGARGEPIRLIVGLGNPGAGYERTRHNAGFWFLDELARHHAGSFRGNAGYQGETCRLSIGGQGIWLLKPMTFMNRSGGSVAALARFFKFPPETLLVAHDELDLPPGTVRFKRSGGHGGHNGLRDIHAQLGSGDYRRIRIGIGHPGHAREVTDYVLQRPSDQDRELIEAAVDAAVQELPLIVAGEYAAAMNTLHGR